MNSHNDSSSQLLRDKRFIEAIKLFNSSKWYPAHDALEELWHEASGPERKTLQAVLQIAVAQVHLENGNKNGAVILLGEGLGRLRDPYIHDLGLDIEGLCTCVQERLSLLQNNSELDSCSSIFLSKRHSES